MTQKIDQPIPQGLYLPAVRHGDIIYTSGMTPRQNGKLQFPGKILLAEDIAIHREAVRLATQNALTAARACLVAGEGVAAALQLNVFLSAAQDFSAHSKLADYASEYLLEELGDIGIGCRAAIGVATLPSDAKVEVTLTVSVKAT